MGTNDEAANAYGYPHPIGLLIILAVRLTLTSMPIVAGNLAFSAGGDRKKLRRVSRMGYQTSLELALPATLL